MKWTLFNAFGAMAWLAGLSFAKGVQLPLASGFAVGDHQFALGLVCGAVGLVTLLWTNLQSTT